MSLIRRFLILLLVMTTLVACDDRVPEMSDSAFHEFTFGVTEAQAQANNTEEKEPTTLEEVKTQFPKYSQEFVWHRKGDETIPSYRNQVVLIYRTRNGQFYLQFEDHKLVAKKKIQLSSL